MWLIAPGFLWALAAVSLPIWLHLSRRRKYREMQVGTLRFLRETMRERKRRSRLEEIPLLLLRLLVVGLLALVFVRPVWQRTAPDDSSRDETLVLLDASGSVTSKMAATAHSAAEKAVKDAHPGTVTLAQFSDDAERIDSLDKYRPRPGAPSHFATALDWALNHFQMQGHASGKIVLIAHPAADTLPARPPRVWPPQFGVELIPLPPPSPDNAAVRGVTLLTPFVADEMELEARLVLPPGGRDRTVTLDAEGFKQSVIAPSGADRVTFRFHPPRPEMRGWISVGGGDPWPADDRRPFVVRWTEPRRILLVDGRPGSTPFDGQAYFLRQALEASGAEHGKSPFRADIVFGLEGNHGLLDLKGVGAVALCGVNEISPAVARSLAQFVKSGGGLFISLDENWTPQATAALVDTGLFPDQIAFTGEITASSFATWDHSFPALAPFDNQEGGDLRELKWRDGFDLRPSPGWRSLASLASEHSILLVKNSSEPTAGSVIVCAQPLTRAWTDLPLDPLFVPLMKNLFATVSRLPASAANSEPESPGLRETRAPGLYNRPDGSTEVISADSEESLVQPATAAAFRAAFGLPEPEARKVEAATETAARTKAPNRTQPGELWPWLTLALCLTLLIENLVATRRRTVRSAAA